MALLGLDQLTKALSQVYLSDFVPVSILPKVLTFQLAHNYGAAYSLFLYRRFFLIGMGILALGLAIGYVCLTKLSNRAFWAMAFFISGSLGNLLDRLFRGFVVDFIDIRLFPIFNLADMFINLGVLVLLWELWRTDESSSSI